LPYVYSYKASCATLGSNLTRSDTGCFIAVHTATEGVKGLNVCTTYGISCAQWTNKWCTINQRYHTAFHALRIGPITREPQHCIWRKSPPYVCSV